MSRRYVPAGAATDGGDPLAITPADAGWTYSGLRVIALAPGEARTIATGDSELFVLPLSATGLTVTVGDDVFAVEGRDTVFARVTDFVYVGRDSEVTISGIVTDLQYLGAESRIRLAIADGSHLLASVPSDGLVGVAIGEPLRVAWSRYAAFVVADTNTEGGDE